MTTLTAIALIITVLLMIVITALLSKVAEKCFKLCIEKTKSIETMMLSMGLVILAWFGIEVIALLILLNVVVLF